VESVKRARKLCLKVSFAVSRAPESYMSKVTRTYEIVFCLAVVSRASTHGEIPTIDKYEVCCGKISVVDANTYILLLGSLGTSRSWRMYEGH